MRTYVALGALTLLFFGVQGKAGWWDTMSLYHVYPRSFKDSNGDGIGDLKGIESKLQHLVDSKIDAFWISPIFPSPMVDFGYDISDFLGIDPVFGTMKDFEDLLKAAHNHSLKVIIDFVPNHTSDKHEWFQKSVKKIDPYTDYYVWHKGKIVNGKRVPPNNWIGLLYGSIWSWNEERKAYYLHEFTAQQPDLNYRNKHVVEEMKNVLRFWLDKGVDGIRVDAPLCLVEAEHLRDEPRSGESKDPNYYKYLKHIYTFSQNEDYEIVRQWREVVDEYGAKGQPRVMMIEAYTNIELTMKYYEYGVHFPFNFGLITSVGPDSNASTFKGVIDNWMLNLPKGATSNWVIGNHDRPRLVTRFGVEFAAAITAMVQLLPGVAVTYYGDEIGMENTKVSWEQTVDPLGRNAGKQRYAQISRDPCRTPFQWDNTTSAGFSTNPKTWLPVNENYKTVNLAAEKAAKDSYYNSFVKITHLRKMPAVREGLLETKLLNNDVLAFSRYLKGQSSVYVVINVSNKTQTISLKAFKNASPIVELYHSTSKIPARIGTKSSPDRLDIPARSASIYISSDNHSRQ